MDFAIFAIAFNLGKLFKKVKNVSKKQKKSTIFTKNQFFFGLMMRLTPKKNVSRKNQKQNYGMAA
jgi:hypothetical protein